jgi:hypothetical protein
MKNFIYIKIEKLWDKNLIKKKTDYLIKEFFMQNE